MEEQYQEKKAKAQQSAADMPGLAAYNYLGVNEPVSRGLSIPGYSGPISLEDSKKIRNRENGHNGHDASRLHADSSMSKDAYGKEGQRTHLLTEDYLNETYHPTRIEGTIQKTGLAIFRKINGIETLVAAVPGREWLQDTSIIDRYFLGGRQRRANVSPYIMRDLGENREAEIAQQVLDEAMAGRSPESEGAEREAWLFDSRLGILFPAKPELQIEAQQALVEFPLDPDESTTKSLLRRAEQIITFNQGLKRENPNLHLLDMSVPPVGHPNDPGMRPNNGEEAAYVSAAHRRLKKLVSGHDKYATQVGSFVSQLKSGDPNATLNDMHASEEGISYWGVAALHKRKKVRHVPDEEGKLVVPSRIAISVANVFGSDMGSVVKLLSYNAAIMYGQRPEVMTPDGPRKALDYRVAYQGILGTALPPDELIRDYDQLKENITVGMVNSDIPGPDRGAFYRNSDDGGRVYSGHADARIRMGTLKDNGGVESVTRNMSPDLAAEAGSDYLLHLLYLKAHEPVAAHASGQEYFNGKYGESLTTNKNRLEITHGYNFNGPRDTLAKQQILYCLEMLEDMRVDPKYKKLDWQIDIVEARVKNLLVDATADNLADYQENRKGTVAQVIANAYESKKQTAIQIAKDVEAFQLIDAENLVASQGHLTPELLYGTKAT